MDKTVGNSRKVCASKLVTLSVEFMTPENIAKALVDALKDPTLESAAIFLERADSECLYPKDGSMYHATFCTPQKKKEVAPYNLIKIVAPGIHS